MTTSPRKVYGTKVISCTTCADTLIDIGTRIDIVKQARGEQ